MARVNYNGRLVKIILKEFLSIENICDYLTDIFSARLTKEERENFKVLSSIPNWESALKDFISNLDSSERGKIMSIIQSRKVTGISARISYNGSERWVDFLLCFGSIEIRIPKSLWMKYPYNTDQWKDDVLKNIKIKEDAYGGSKRGGTIEGMQTLFPS